MMHVTTPRVLLVLCFFGYAAWDLFGLGVGDGRGGGRDVVFTLLRERERESEDKVADIKRFCDMVWYVQAAWLSCHCVVLPL